MNGCGALRQLFGRCPRATGRWTQLMSPVRTEPITTPSSMRAVSPDPAEDAELAREFFESNKAAYADLRDRGLLPPEGETSVRRTSTSTSFRAGRRPPGATLTPPIPPGGANSVRLGGGWDELLRDELDKAYLSKLLEFITYEHENYDVYPPRAQTFKALELSTYEATRVVILGQDPYHGPGQAHGLCFSVPDDVPRSHRLSSTS
jgi:hypothetical protein